MKLVILLEAKMVEYYGIDHLKTTVSLLMMTFLAVFNGSVLQLLMNWDIFFWGTISSKTIQKLLVENWNFLTVIAIAFMNKKLIISLNVFLFQYLF